MNKYLALWLLSILASASTYCQSSIVFNIDDLPNDQLQNVGIRGNVSPLSWEQSLLLEKKGNVYSITIDFQETDEELQFKFVNFDNDQEPNWEGIANRTLKLTQGEILISNNSWSKESVVDINALKPISPQDLQKDFELIQTMVLDVHPGTYRYNSKEEIKRALDSLKSAFRFPLSHGQAYLEISKLTARLKCDHTKAGFNNQNRVINSVIHYQSDKLPFTFKWIDDQMVIIHNASKNTQLTRGVIVKSINDIPVLEIRKQLLPYVAADGSTDANRLSKLEVDGYDFRYNAFDIFYPLVFPVDSIINLEIKEYQKDDAQFIKVNSLTRDERAKILMDKYEEFPKSRDDMWNFEVLEDSIGLLTINSFGLYGWKAMSLDYKEYLKSVFAQINKLSINHLIIDIRKNTGGNDEIAEELFSYLTDVNFQFQREGRTRYINFPESLKPHIQTWGDDTWYFDLNPKVKTPSNGYYIFKDDKKENSDIISDNKYNGSLYLISGNANTSLAFYTAYKFKLQELGLIVGQETGGNLNDINGGQILFLRLPNSEIEIDFPVIGAFALESRPDMGVQPNVPTEYSIEDVINKRDVEIESVLKIINEN